jgi:hypothetical protein
MRQASAYIGVVAINGTPAQRTTTWSEQDLAIVPTSMPPAAQQPPDPVTAAVYPIATNDDRFTSVVWDRGVLWATGNDGCTLSGDTAERSCVKLVAVATATPAWLVRDLDAAVAGSYLYFPAVAVDSSGNMIVAFSQSSATQDPSVEATGELVSNRGTPAALFPESMVMAGQAVYHCSDSCANGANGDRWGDYSSAALEPCGSAAVWIADEYMADGGDQTDWGTAAGNLLVNGSQRPQFQPCAWEDHGGVLAAGVAASTWGPKRLDVFVRGTDGYLYHHFMDDFNPWQWDPYLPPLQVTSDASSVSIGGGSVDVFVRGTDGALWHTTYRAGTTSGFWESLGGALMSGTAPSAVSPGPGNIDVFVEGPDRQLWDDSYNSATQTWTWAKHGGILATTPSAVVPLGGVSAAFVEGSDATLWLWTSNGGWTGYGGRLAARPAAVSSSIGTLDAFVEGVDHVLYHWSTAINGGWEAVGGQLASAPSAASWGNGRIDVLGQGTDSTLWHAWSQNGQGPWSWEGNKGSVIGSPAAVTYGPGTLHVFVRGADNHLWHLPFD